MVILEAFRTKCPPDEMHHYRPPSIQTHNGKVHLRGRFKWIRRVKYSVGRCLR